MDSKYSIDSFPLINPATDVLHKVLGEIWFENADPDIKAQEALGALEGGAHAQAMGVYRQTALVLLAYSWDSSARHAKALKPVAEKLIPISSPKVIDEALKVLIANAFSKSRVEGLANMLLSHGGQVEESAWNFASNSDTPLTEKRTIEMIQWLDELGAPLNCSYQESNFLMFMIEQGYAQAFDLFVSLYEKHDIDMHHRLTDGHDPLCAIYMKQRDLAKNQGKKRQAHEEMAKRLAYSGLAKTPEPITAWKDSCGKQWLEEALIDGQANRLARRSEQVRQVQPALKRPRL